MVLGGLSTFNIAHGYTEALVRGFRSGFLNDSDYHHLTQCENLEVCKESSHIHLSFVICRFNIGFRNDQTLQSIIYCFIVILIHD